MSDKRKRDSDIFDEANVEKRRKFGTNLTNLKHLLFVA